MPFDLIVWKEKVAENLPGWKARMKKAGVDSVYAFISAAALWPVIEAAQAGEWAALAALGGALSGLGSNLLANRIQNWKDESDAAHQIESSIEDHPDLRAELDAVLERLDAFSTASQGLSEDDQKWFAETLEEELAKIESGIDYQAIVIGRGASAQGEGAKAVGAGGMLVEGDYFHAEQIIFPDSNQLMRKKQTQVRARYLQQLYRDCQTLPLVDLGSDPGSGEKVTLKDVYIALNTTHRVPVSETEEQDPKTKPEMGPRERDERPYSALEAVAEHHNLALLGGPGSGKSTFGRFLTAWQAAAELGEVEHPPNVEQGLLPIFLVLRDLIPETRGWTPDELPARKRRSKLLEVIQDQIKTEFTRLHGSELAEELDQILNTGKCLLVLDGLDELPQEFRPHVRQAVGAFRSAYPVERIMLTCRVRSYEGEAVQPGFSRYTLAPFTREQVQGFAQAWYQTQARMGEIPSQQAEPKAKDLAGAAWEEDLRELAQNPMMLTTMAIIHQKEYKLPTQRVRLYHVAVEVLLQRWQKRKTGEELTDYPELNALLKDDLRLRRIMERLAYEAHQSGEDDRAADLPRMDALAILEEERYIGNLELAKKFLDYVDQRAGLLVGRGGDPDQPTDYSFPHRTFQEYLAGCYLTGHREADRKIIEHAQEPEYWSLAVEMGAEEIYYNGGSIGVNSVLDLIYALSPRGEIDTCCKARRTLWAGKLAALVGGVVLRDDEKQEGQVVLEQLRGDLADMVIEKIGTDTNQRITAPERADAGCVLGKLGDPRGEIVEVDAMQFCYIPAGPFQMGSREGEEDVYEDEQPQHRVNLSNFWMSQYPITNVQYQRFVKAGGYAQEDYWKEAKENGVWENGHVYREYYLIEEGKVQVLKERENSPHDFGDPYHLPNHPVVGVTWYEALAFTRWLTEYYQEKGFLKNAWRVRLPSEAEWEKAARGGVEVFETPDIQEIRQVLSVSLERRLIKNPNSSRVYPWGNEFDPEKVNAGATGIEATSTPGCFPGGASPYGVLDLSGNVWEWTRSLWGEDWENPEYNYPYDPGDGREDLESGRNVRRVLRGGAFYCHARFVRCAYRGRNFPHHWNLNGNGFRVVVSSRNE